MKLENTVITLEGRQRFNLDKLSLVQGSGLQYLLLVTRKLTSL
jgi:hypothetical protein